jgi:glutamate/tyrosine decarboxylase-like PLP-dependent enzyme
MNNPVISLQRTFEIAQKYLTAEKTTPVLPYKSPEELLDALDLSIQEEGQQENDFFDNLEKLVLSTPKTASNAFFNQLFGGRNLPALSGEMLAALLNSSMYTFKVAGPQVLVEKEVISRMLQKIGYAHGDGTFTSGGSMSNMMAMMVARNEKDESIRNQGFNGQKMMAYTSAEGHYCIKKNAGMLGLGRDNVREIKTDSRGKMDTDHLVEQIEYDLTQGYIPFFINATAGTTVRGAFDPFEKIAVIARQYHIWFHIDGAFGGSVPLSRKHKHLITGSELSDSYTWNAHKMMNIPLTASIILMNHPHILRKHLSEKADYLFQGEDDYNPGEQNPQCGRKNDALKVWSAWKYWGDKGYEARINRVYELAKYAVDYINQDNGLELLENPECVAVCFEVKDKPSDLICRMLDQKALVKVGYGKVNEQLYIRVVFVNPDITFSDIDDFFHHVKAIAQTIEAVVVG